MSETFAFPASLVEGPTISTITAFNVESSEPVFLADSFHPYWTQILFGLRTGDPNVWDLFDVSKTVMRSFKNITERVSWNGSEVLWDGDVFRSPVADFLNRLILQGEAEHLTAFAHFVEKLEANPLEHSREQAYDWLATHKFQITPDGDVVGYKGVQDKGNGLYHSVWSSQVTGVPSAFVNGTPVPELSQVPQRVGDTVTMPRSEVSHDPHVTCSRGLHVATRAYALSYGEALLEVFANPRDFVSVPNAGKKVRTCRYFNNRIVTGKGDDAETRAVLTDTNYQWTGDVGTRV